MSLRFLTAGESHGPMLVAILEGLPAGLPLSEDHINPALKRRQQGFGSGGRMRIENDTARLLSGVMGGVSTGAPLAMLIENRDHDQWQGHPIDAFTIPRPGHADLTGAIKYGFSDLRPALERASGRETAARVAMGAVCQLFLRQFDIHVGGYVAAIGPVKAELNGIALLDRPERALDSPVACPDPDAGERMVVCIRQAMSEKDSLGGVIEAIAWGVPPGLGSYAQWDRRLDSRLGAALLSIPAIKGIEISTAFENATMLGTQVQDAILLDGDRLVRPTNHCGGLEGGISTGQPIVVRAAMKPIATTLTPQASVDLASGVPSQTHYERSDICPVPRAVPVVEGMLAFVLADALLEKLGGDSLEEMLPRYKALRQANLNDLRITGEPTLFWSGDRGSGQNAR